ncbi:MAG TPA: hypothetical protein VGM88_16875 [Kofleriaceae bacterium]
MKLAGGALALVACALPPQQTPPKPPPERVAIVVAEGVGSGFRLVAIDEHGDRRFALIASGDHDTEPAISPDGKWIAFARRTGEHKQLFVAPLGAEQAARPLTDAIALDASPAWTADGRTVVFASTRGGSFDLWRVSTAGGAPEQLTFDAGHEVAPSVASDGTIYYTSVQQVSADSAETRSWIAVRLPDGKTHRVTEGPADASPAISPDGRLLAFVRRTGDAPDHELVTLALGVAGAEPLPLVRLPLTDESGPVWSRDGRFVLATSILRGDDGRPVFSSVIAIDRAERVARILEDRAGAAPRLSPAIAPVMLDAAALHADPEYLPELMRIVHRAIEKQVEQ